MLNHKELRKQITALTAEYYKARFEEKEFMPGKTKVNYAGRVFDEEELQNAVNASLDFWLTEGRFSEEFSSKISDFLSGECAAHQFGLFRQPVGVFCPDFRETWRQKAETWRGGNLCGRRVPRHRDTHHPERTCTGVRGSQHPDL